MPPQRNCRGRQSRRLLPARQKWEITWNLPPPKTIARIWRGRTTRERADEYEAYNYEVGIKPLIEKALGVQSLREDGKYETEFMTISYWESVEAMARFTGGDPNQIHHLPRDAELPDRAAARGPVAAAADQPWRQGLIAFV